MTDRHSHSPSDASDGAPRVLGHRLQPHRGRWRGLRLRACPWVFLGLTGIVPEVRMQGLRVGEADMAWKAPPPGAPAGQAFPREGRPAPRGPEGPPGRPGRDASPETARTESRPAEDVPGRERKEPKPPAIGMFLFQQASPAGLPSRRPAPAPPLAGILDGRTGVMTTGGISGPAVSAIGPQRLEGAGLVPATVAAGAETPGMGRGLAQMAARGSAQEGVDPAPRPPRAGPAAPILPGEPPAQMDAPVAPVFRSPPPGQLHGEPAGPQPGRGDGAAPPGTAHAPPTLHPAAGSGFGVLSRALALFPGIGFQPRPETDPGGRERPAGTPPIIEAAPDLEMPSPWRGRHPGDPLPLRRAGGGFPAGPGAATTVSVGIPPRPEDPTLPAASPRGGEMTVIVSAIEQAVARQVEKALKAGRRAPPPERPAPPGPGPADEPDGDRMARRLADRLRRLAREERFRRGRLR